MYFIYVLIDKRKPTAGVGGVTLKKTIILIESESLKAWMRKRWRNMMINSEKILSPIDIRLALRGWIVERFKINQNDLLIDELGFSNKDPNSTIDSSFRADLALANGRLVGFEIKSEKDNLKRWITQMDAYLNVFDEVWLCVHGKHLESALTITPKTIGIIVVDNYESLALVRSAKKQSSNNAYDLSGLLWRDELNDLASQHKIQIRSRTTKNEVREILAKNLDIEIIREFVLKQLKIRKSHQTSSVSPIVS